jgi:hypothetical protein
MRTWWCFLYSHHHCPQMPLLPQIWLCHQQNEIEVEGEGESWYFMKKKKRKDKTRGIKHMKHTWPHS